MRAWKELEAYLDEMVTARRDAMTDDLLSDMMRAEVACDRLSHDELLTLAATELMAGPTPRSISWPLPCRSSASTPTNGGCWPNTPSW